MRDIDFILAVLAGDPPPLDRPFVYRYRSGVLCGRMRAALRKVAAGDGLNLERDRPPLRPGFDNADVFLSQLMVFEWPERTSERFRATSVTNSLALLATSLDRPGVHFVRHGSAVGRYPGWRVVERGALVIEEPLVTRENLPAMLRYLAADTDLAAGADLLGQRGFVESFAGLVEERAGLSEMIQAFEERVLLCTNPSLNHYDEVRFRSDAVRRHGWRAPLTHLRELTALRRERDLIDWLCGFDERRAERGWTALRLVAELYGITNRLLEPATARRRSRSKLGSHVLTGLVTEEAVLWAALVLAYEDSLIRCVREERDGYRRGPDLLVPALSSLAHDFLGRQSLVEAGDPLAGRWTALSSGFARCGVDVLSDPGDPLTTARGRLVRGLAAALARRAEEGPDWLRSLRNRATATCERLNEKMRRDEEWVDEETLYNAQGMRPPVPPLIHIPSPSPLHRNLATVIGRTHVVAGLRRHARERTAGVDLLLYGPDGVGKRTLAWSYGRMVLCQVPSSEGAACGKCASCRAFETENSSCIEVDGAREDIERLTEQIVERVQNSSLLAQRYVFVIPNADRYPPALFDKLLKPMEDSARASFVLLARNRRDVRLAVLSRCFDYRVRPLNRSEAEAFMRKVLAARSVICDEATLALLLDAGGGLPTCLLTACRVLINAKLESFEAMRMKLDLGWAEDLLKRWPAIVAGVPAVSANLGGVPSTDHAEQVRRVLAVLQLVSLHRVHESHCSDVIDPALRQLDDQSCATFKLAIDQQAVRDGTTAASLWLSMVETWLSDQLATG